MARISTRLRPIIRVFVSSPFSDFRFERDALQRYAFRDLERRCLEEGFQFQAIDLRWGVPTEAVLDHCTMRICFEELRRSQEVSPEPNFLILLGNRYGWRPLPEEISAGEFKMLVTAARSGGEEGQPIAGSHNKSAAQILREWYRCDRNVLVRNPQENEPDRTTLNYILQPRAQDLGDGRDYTQTRQQPPADTQEWRDVQDVLWNLINVAFPHGELAQRFNGVDWQQRTSEVHDRQNPKRAVPQTVRFQGSATEQEIWAGALAAPAAEQHVLAVFRDICNQDSFAAQDVKDFFDVAHNGAINEETGRFQQQLKKAVAERLGENRVLEYNKVSLIARGEKLVLDFDESWAKAFGKRIVDALWPTIERQIHQWRTPEESNQVTGTAHGKISPERELEIEREEHRRIAAQHAASFVGRNERNGPLQRIREYLNNDSREPFVIHGVSGCGKTALAAKAFQDVSPSASHIIRFLGVTPKSSDLRSLLTNLCREFRCDNPMEQPLPAEIHELQREFRQHLQGASDRGSSVILFLDALDQLTDADGALHLRWLPGSSAALDPLPRNVKIVVSCLSDREQTDPAAQPYVALQRRELSGDNMLNLDALSLAEAKTLLFGRWLEDAGRTFQATGAKGQDSHQEAQRNLIEQRLASDEQCRQPLFLKLLFEEVKRWRSYDSAFTLYDPESRAGDVKQDDPHSQQSRPASPNPHVDALLKQLVARLSREDNHGALLVERALGYIAAARRGLSETEILEILFADKEYKQGIDDESKKNKHELPTDPPRVPIAIWSRLRSDLAPYLTERAAPGGNPLALYHRQVSEWIKSRFVLESDWDPHGRLAEFFGRQKYFLESIDDQTNRAGRQQPARLPANIRKVDELPFQKLEVAKQFGGSNSDSQPWQAVENLLCDLHLVEAKCAAGMLFELLGDYEAAQSAWPHYSRDRIFDRPIEAPDPEWLRECVESVIEQRSAVHAEKGSGPVIAHLGNLPDELGEQASSAAAQAADGPLPEGSFGCGERTAAVLQRLRQQTPADRQPDSHRVAQRLEAFADFVSTYGHVLETRPENTIPFAYNHAATGWVAEAAEGLMKQFQRPWVSRNERPPALAGRACLRTLTDHDGDVDFTCLAWDGNTAVAAGDDRLYVWDLEAGRLRWKTEVSGGFIRVAVDPLCRWAVTGGVERLQIWDLDRGQYDFAHEERCHLVAISADGRLVLASGKAESARSPTPLVLIDRVTGKVDRFEMESDLRELAISGDGRLAVNVQHGNLLNIWDVAQRRRLLRIETPGVQVNGLALTPDGRWLATADLDEDLGLVIWDLTTGRLVRKFPVQHGFPNDVGVALTPDGRIAAVAKWEGILVCDIVRGQPLQFFPESRGSATGVGLTPDGRLLISGGGSGQHLRIWDVTGQIELSLDNPDSVRFLGSGAHRGSHVAVLTNPEGKIVFQDVTNLKTLPDKSIASDLENGKIERTLLAPDDRSVYWAGSIEKNLYYEKEIEVLAAADLQSGKLRRLKSRAPDATYRQWSVRDLAVTPDGRALICRANVGLDDRVIFWLVDVASGEIVRQQGDEESDNRHQARGQIAFGPDGRVVAWSQALGLHLHDIISGQTIGDLSDGRQGRSDRASCVALAPNGRSAVTGGGAGWLRVWDLVAGECRFRISTGLSEVRDLVVTPDGSTVLAAGRDALELQAWSLQSGECLATYPVDMHVSAITGIDGRRRFAVKLADGTLHSLQLREACTDPPIVTGVRRFAIQWNEVDAHPPHAKSTGLPGVYDSAVKACCPFCFAWFPVSEAHLAVIRDHEIALLPGQSPCLRLPSEAFQDPRLIVQCPLCDQTMRLNPFVVDMEQLFRLLEQRFQLLRRLAEDEGFKRLDEAALSSRDVGVKPRQQAFEMIAAELADVCVELDDKEQTARLMLLQLMTSHEVKSQLIKVKMFHDYVVDYNLIDAARDGREVLDLLRDRADLRQSRAALTEAREYVNTGRYQEARAAFMQAYSNDSLDWLVAQEFAWFLATCPEPAFRDGVRAVELAQTACRLTGWKNGVCLDVLGAAFARTGDFDSAAYHAGRAVSHGVKCPQERAADVRERLAMYKKALAYPE